MTSTLSRSNDTKNDYTVDETVHQDEGTIRVTKVSSVTTVLVSGESALVYSRYALAALLITAGRTCLVLGRVQCADYWVHEAYIRDPICWQPWLLIFDLDKALEQLPNRGDCESGSQTYST